MQNTILMMDDDMENVAPVNEINQPVVPPTPPASPARNGGTIIDTEAVQKPSQMPSFTEVIQAANASQNAPTANNVNRGQAPSVPEVPAQQVSTSQSAASANQKPTMSRKKKIIIAAAGLAGIAGIATAATMLRKSSEDALAEGGMDGEGFGNSLFGGLSGTSVEGDDLSFGQAFSNARSELGANGVFKWRGQLYGTMLKEEWDDLSDEGRQQFAHESQSVSLDNDFPDNDSDEAVAVMDADETDPAVEGEAVDDDDDVIEGEAVDDDDVIEGEAVDDDDDVIEGEAVDDDDDVIEGEAVDDDNDAIEGEAVDDDDDVIEGEAVDDDTIDEEVMDTDGEYIDDIDDEEIIDDDDDFADYMNDEDTSDFV